MERTGPGRRRKHDAVAPPRRGGPLRLPRLVRPVPLPLCLCCPALFAAAPPTCPPGWPLPAGAVARLTTEAEAAGAVVCVALSPDGKRVAAARSGQGTVWVWD